MLVHICICKERTLYSQNDIHTVSSFQIACSCVPNITAVKMANKRASNAKNNNNTTVAGGLNVEHSRHSCLTHVVNCCIHRNKDCNDMPAI